jgi:DNA uptake protein ComE-like DNA-binding protein
MLTDFLNFLNQYANLVMALSSALLVFVTIIYAFFTMRMVREMKLARMADLRPYLITDVFLFDTTFHLIIKNTGKTAAHSVTFKLDKSIVNMWRRKLDEMPIFRSGVAVFAPGKQIVITLGPAHLFFGKNDVGEQQLANFTIIMEYLGFDKKTITETSVINLEEYKDTKAYPNEVAKAIANIGNVMGQGLNSIACSAERLSKLADIASPTGLDISQGSLYRIAEIMNEKAKKKIKFDLNFISLTELVELLGIELEIAEKIMEKKYGPGYFNSFDDLEGIDGMTPELLQKIKRQTFICIQRY